MAKVNLDDLKLRPEKLRGMSTSDLYALYKTWCAHFRDVNNWIAEVRGILRAKQDIDAKAKELEAAKAKFATNAGQGGGL